MNLIIEKAGVIDKIRYFVILQKPTYRYLSTAQKAENLKYLVECLKRYKEEVQLFARAITKK